MDSHHAAGSLFGAIMASYKSFLVIMTSLGFVSWELVIDTAMLAAIGGAVGWAVAETLKLLKQLIRGAYIRHKNKDND